MGRRVLSEVERTAREQLGFARLRPGQEEAVRSVLAGQDTLVVQPTGSGKSAIYQVAGLLRDGPTVVISPLIALQKDQIDSIDEQPHDAQAHVLNSSIPAAQARETIEQFQNGEVEFLFLAPEQLAKPEVRAALKAGEPSLIVVDEAHCISEWGHDFRPDYLTIGSAAEEIGRPVILAMTATASSEVREEIVRKLNLRDPRIFVRGFDRPNLNLRVDVFQTEDEKLAALIRRIRFATKPGIVYVATRKNAETIMGMLQEEGIPSLFYHAGLRGKDREQIQEQFMDGETEVIVATNAFGMGVDKADIRFVYHFEISDSIDSYYQEIGRAGRDGEPAEAVLFYRSQNIGLRKFQAGSGKLERRQIEAVADIIQREVGPVDAKDVARQTELSQRKVTSVLNRLEEIGALETAADGDVQLAGGLDPASAAEAAAGAHDQFQEAQRKRVEMMQRYAEINTCRREFLLRYFGEEFQGPCGNCDNDGPAKVETTAGTRREVV